MVETSIHKGAIVSTPPQARIGFPCARTLSAAHIANTCHGTSILPSVDSLGSTSFNSVMDITHMATSLAAIAKEVSAWFFEDYLPTWVAVGAGKGSANEDFILRY